MRFRLMTVLFCALAAALAGCSAAGPSGAKLGLGPDGSVHPDDTAGLADYTGQGRDSEGWAGNSDGEGGPSAVPPAPHDPQER